MTIWFIADTHFGEQPKGRLKASGLSAEELDALIEERWREKIAGGDEVWHLGDVGDWRRLADLPGVKHLIFGNCDGARKAMRSSPLFASTAVSHRTEIGGRALFLVHNPEHAAKDEEALVVHGHLHAKPSTHSNGWSVSVDRHDWGPVQLAFDGAVD